MNLINAVYCQKLEAERARGQVVWPSSKYARDPVQFCIDVLGFAPTSAQAEIMRAVVTHRRTTCKSGRKIGKSRTAAALGLWWYCTHADATVVLLAPSEHQIAQIVYHDLVQLYRESGRCLSCRQRDPGGPRPCPHSACIDGELSTSCRTGLRRGARRLFGISPRNSDHMRGISGRNQMYLLDECSGIDDPIWEACEGNLAGSDTGRAALFGNPAARQGFYWDSFDAMPFHRITVSSLTSPNVALGRLIVPGLADKEWCEGKLSLWGEDDPRYQVEVLGSFPTREMLRLISDVELAAAFERWNTMETDEHAALYIGIDPAGGGHGNGDMSTIVLRRGSKILLIRAFRGGTDRIMSEVVALIAQHRKYASEPVVINFDVASAIGADLKYALQKLKLADDFVRFIPLESRGDAHNDPLLRSSGCARPRDAYWLNMCQRLKTDVGIPYDDELRAELLFAEWQQDREQVSRLIEKKQFRRLLGRSPDRADALAYCLWEGRVAPLSNAARRENEAPRIDDGRARATPLHDPYRASLDPYEDGFDPYAAQDALDPRCRR